MPDKVALVIGPTGATGGPIAAALARRPGWRVYDQLDRYRDARLLPR